MFWLGLAIGIVTGLLTPVVFGIILRWAFQFMFGMVFLPPKNRSWWK